jgi:hypothetical protein
MKKSQIVTIAIFFGAAIWAITIALVPTFPNCSLNLSITNQFQMTPWQSVGGCGTAAALSPAQQSSFSSVWTEPLRSPERLNAQLTFGTVLGQSASSQHAAPRIYGNPFINFISGITVPLVWQQGEFQVNAFSEPSDRVTSGISDIAIDAGYVFFIDNPLALRLALQLPSGNYAVKRGSDRASYYLPSRLQHGTGMYAATIGMEHQRQFCASGRWDFHLVYTHPFAMRLFTGKNEFLASSFIHYAGETDNRRYYYRFKPYGENDLGRYIPPSVTAAMKYSLSTNSVLCHTWGTEINVPFGVEWESSMYTNVYDPHPSADNRAWKTTWTYMPELLINSFTFMGYVAIPLFDKANGGNPDDQYDEAPYAAWDRPDWSDFLQNFNLSVGVRYGILRNREQRH